jgi:hypothetical protein
MDSGPYPHISPDRTKVSLTLAKVFIVGAALVVAAFTVGQRWADLDLKFRGIDARLDDLPTKRMVREQVEELGAARIRELLEKGRWQCVYTGRGKAMWTECRVTFPPDGK